MSLHSLVQSRLVFGSLHTNVLFCAATVTAFATALSHLPHPQLFSSSPSRAVPVLVLPPRAAGCAGGRDCRAFGLLLWCPGGWTARNSSRPCLPVSVSCGNALFFVPQPNFKNKKYPRIAGGEAGQLVPQSPNTSHPGHEDNRVCAAAFPKLLWQFWK